MSLNSANLLSLPVFTPNNEQEGLSKKHGHQKRLFYFLLVNLQALESNFQKQSLKMTNAMHLMFEESKQIHGMVLSVATYHATLWMSQELR